MPRKDDPRKGDIVSEVWTEEEKRLGGCVCSCGNRDLQISDHYMLTDNRGGRQFVFRDIICRKCRSGQRHSLGDDGKIIVQRGKGLSHPEMIKEKGPTGWVETLHKMAKQERLYGEKCLQHGTNDGAKG